MSNHVLWRALTRFDTALRLAEAHAGRSLDGNCERSLDAHRRVLSHLVDTTLSGLLSEAMKAANRILCAAAPIAELKKIQIVRHSIERMQERLAHVRSG